jgi:membrane-associated protease RseP (regulator of RpoE activity)
MEPEARLAAPSRWRGSGRNLLLFLATVATTLWVGAGRVDLPDGAGLGDVALAGLPYASAILAILLAHELGHYLMARAWGVDSTLPFFLPGPPPVGTLGAVIRMRSQFPDRRAVLDIGAAGPLAGLAVAVPLFAWGLSRSEVRPLGDAALAASHADSPLAVLRALLAGQPVLGDGSGAQLMGDSLLSWAMQRAAFGPLPPGHDIFLHPVATAAWFGLLVTTLNLLPIGQLDGGHVLYAWLGRARALRASRLFSWGLLAAGLVLSWNWLVWWLLTRFVIRLGHPPAQEEASLDRGRIAVALLCLVLFALTFIPIPMSI